METIEVKPRQVFKNALVNINDEIEITKWTKDKKRRKELKRLAREVRRDLKGMI